MTRAGVWAVVREMWDRYIATVATAVAGVLIMFNPAPSIDQLVGGAPATWAFGFILALAGALNLAGLITGSYWLQRFGLLLQIPVLLLIALALWVIAPAGRAYALLLVAMAMRVRRQFTTLKRNRAVRETIAAAIVAASEPEPEREP